VRQSQRHLQRQRQRQRQTPRGARIDFSHLYEKSADSLAQEIEAAAETNSYLEISWPHHEIALPVGGGIEPGRYGSRGRVERALGFDAGDRAVRFPEAEAPEVSLWQRLGNQIEAAFRDPDDRSVAYGIMTCLSPAGFVDKTEMAELDARLGPLGRRAPQVLARMQTFEPPGVCATSAGEMIVLQLRARGALTEDAERVADKIELVLTVGWPGLKAACDLGEDRFAAALALVLSTDPRFADRPHSPKAPPLAPAMTPDLLVIVSPSGELVAMRHPQAVPVVRAYDTDKANTREREFRKDARRAARHAREVETFASRLELVGTKLARAQHAFLLNRAPGPQPFSQKDLAKLTGLSKSDISRAVRHRTMQTPRGVVRMQDLFRKDTSLDQAITELHRSDPKMSDASMHLALRRKDYSVSRRTVSVRRTRLGLRDRRAP
jgi:DNA-directed RNA polymerase specialized sigma54-like protein